MMPANSNSKSFHQIFDEYYLALVNFTSFLIKDRDAAETIVIKLFSKIWLLYQDRFYEFENTRWYLFKASYHECQKYLKSKSSAGRNGADVIYQYRSAQVFNQLMGTLPTHLKEIVRLNYIENLPLNQIAIRLRIPLQEVRAYKLHAEDHMAVALHK